jgi:multidrug efflux system outer membrane protein
MKIVRKVKCIAAILLCTLFVRCKAPAILETTDHKPIPSAFSNSTDTTNTADINWRTFFNDKNLVTLIDTAIQNNVDVLMILQDIEIAKNNVRIRNSELFPTVTAGGVVGIEKVGRYTSQGAGDASAEITPGKTVPENLPDLTFGFRASWEADIWGKLRTAKKAAYAKYLSSIEGKNFAITSLVAEISNSYYELLSLDNQLEVIRLAIQLQSSQLEIVKVQKEASVVTELAVKQFEAQVFKSRSVEFDILQQITETENKINFLLNRYPRKIERDTTNLTSLIPSTIKAGIPSQLLKNRPDIKQAELELMSAKWDVKAAQLAFYPSLKITSNLGIQAFNPTYLLTMPESILYSLVGDLTGPIINRNAIMAEFKTANANQMKAMYNYQKTILNSFVEVSSELSNISNLEKMYNLKSKEADVLIKAIDISNDLFKSARANYLEVLTAQRDALATKLELIETKKRQFNSVTNIYKALGGGWR